MKAVFSESGDIAVLTNNAMLQPEGDTAIPENIAIEYYPTWWFDLQHKGLDDLLNDESELGVLFNFLFNPAFKGHKVWLVDVEQKRVKAAGAGAKTFTLGSVRYAEVFNCEDLEARDPDSLFVGSAFAFIWEIMHQLPVNIRHQLYQIGVLVVE